MVEPERVPSRQKSKRTRLLTQIKRLLRNEGVLAEGDEDITSHRVISRLPLDEGLVADLALQNGSMHIVETVDASNEETLKKAVSDIAVAALVLERARIRYKGTTKTQLVYSASPAIENAIAPSLDIAQRQGAILYNWASTSDQLQVIGGLASVAVPLEKKRKGNVRH
jgi:hypothetical protein